jgi:1-acyl-sn-glycerol-3-phosphate acyltransferase
MSGLLGVITKLGGCLFVERRSRERLEAEKKEIAGTIRKGISVFVFPEATSSGGDGVLPFKTALFDCALLAEVPIQPITLYYSKINGQIPTRFLKDHVCYYGDMEFLPSLFRVLSLKSIEATLLFHPSIDPPIALDRKALATQTHALISETYGKLVSCESISGNDARPVGGSLAQWKSAN